MRDNGGGTVIGSEIVHEKVLFAKRNLQEAGLGEFADIRESDARQTLHDVSGPVNFVLIDGWPTNDGPSLALQVVQLLAPRIRVGGLLVNDNAETDYLGYVRDPANGFRSMSIPLKDSTEVSVKVSDTI